MSHTTLVETIIAALPDMSGEELTELESAINAEIQDRYHGQQDEYLDNAEAGSDWFDDDELDEDFDPDDGV